MEKLTRQSLLFEEGDLEITLKGINNLSFKDVSSILDGLDTLFSLFVDHFYKLQCGTCPDTRKDYPNPDPLQKHLFISDIKDSFHFISTKVPLLPWLNSLFDRRTAAETFFDHFKFILDYFAGTNTKLPDPAGAKEAELIRQILSLLADHPKGQLILRVPSQDVDSERKMIIEHQVASEILLKVTQFIQLSNVRVNQNYDKQLLYWVQARFDTDSATGDRGIIESISPKPVKIIWTSLLDKVAIMKSNINQKPWYSLGYVVDLVVQTIKAEPRLYIISNVYLEETFDPMDED